MAIYIIGSCHGLAVLCLVILFNNSVISITNTLELCWEFVASYSLCLIPCIGVFSWSRNLLAVAATVGRQVRAEGVLKEGVPTDREIAELALHIVQIWKRLSRALGLQEAIIIQIQNDEDNVYERAISCLNKWRQMMGGQANYEALAQALGREEIARYDLIQRFCYAVLEEPDETDDNPQDGIVA